MRAMDQRDAFQHGTLASRLNLALGRELHSDEEVVWQGPQMARLELRNFALYLFAIPWTAFSLFWTAMAFAAFLGWEDGGWESWLGIAFPLFGVPFVAIGFAMLAAPFMPLWEAGKVLYAVTNKRVLKLRLSGKLHVQSALGRRIGRVDRLEDRSGAGRLKLAIWIGLDSDGDARTEYFEVGQVRDIMGAHRAISQLVGA
ncbi:MAG: hypothetical protein V2J51_08005 [Erythrobacter sp.]|jgi:hypothetical protein|nr:hypothetical protein [Erythrobacter sp.]